MQKSSWVANKARENLAVFCFSSLFMVVVVVVILVGEGEGSLKKGKNISQSQQS